MLTTRTHPGSHQSPRERSPADGSDAESERGLRARAEFLRSRVSVRPRSALRPEVRVRGGRRGSATAFAPIHAHARRRVSGVPWLPHAGPKQGRRRSQRRRVCALRLGSGLGFQAQPYLTANRSTSAWLTRRRGSMSARSGGFMTRLLGLEWIGGLSGRNGTKSP